MPVKISSIYLSWQINFACQNPVHYCKKQHIFKSYQQNPVHNYKRQHISKSYEQQQIYYLYAELVMTHSIWRNAGLYNLQIAAYT